MKFILLINVKMPTIVVILTLISMINTSSERLKARNFLSCRYFSFYINEQLKFVLSSVEHRKKFYNLGTRAGIHRMLVTIANREDPNQTASSGAV